MTSLFFVFMVGRDQKLLCNRHFLLLSNALLVHIDIEHSSNREQEDFVLIFNKRKQDSLDSTITASSEDMGQIKSRLKHSA